MASSKNVVVVSDANFEAEVTNSPIPVLVDFSATWCGPCKQLTPIIEKLADEAGGRFKVAAVDVDDCPGVAGKFGIRSVPTVMVFRGGQVAGQRVGLTNKETLLKMIEG